MAMVEMQTTAALAESRRKMVFSVSYNIRL